MAAEAHLFARAHVCAHLNLRRPYSDYPYPYSDYQYPYSDYQYPYSDYQYLAPQPPQADRVSAQAGGDSALLVNIVCDAVGMCVPGRPHRLALLANAAARVTCA